jgi:hypothetical protein
MASTPPNRLGRRRSTSSTKVLSYQDAKRGKRYFSTVDSKQKKPRHLSAASEQVSVEDSQGWKPTESVGRRLHVALDSFRLPSASQGQDLLI